jgi:ssDNA-binding Zn-finger/Zn-ribbon topoisomerase 1
VKVPQIMNTDASWESVHVCPKCGHIINLAELDLRSITTGIVTCPSCDWSGQIEIQVIDQVPRKRHDERLWQRADGSKARGKRSSR